MIFRNSINSIIRLRGKTVLFTLLIFALTLVLALSISIWASVEQFLKDCDEYYTTIGLIEYMGTRYPDDHTYDEMMHHALDGFDASVIQADEATEHWDVSSRSMGYIDGFWRSDNYMPQQMFSVVVVGNVGYDSYHDEYNAIVMDVLYSYKVKENISILIDPDFGTFERGHYYLIFGEAYFNQQTSGRTTLLHFRPATFSNTLAEDVTIPRMIDITRYGGGDQLFRIPEDSIMLEVAKTLEVVNNSVLVTGTDDLMSLFPFHQQELYFVEGRAFTDEEYREGSRVVVLSELMASRLGVGVGDTVNLSTAISDFPGIENSYWSLEGFDFTGPFTIVGITNNVLDKSWHVFVPRSSGVPFSKFPVGYTVGTVTINNRDAAGFFERIEPTLGERFQLTIYDQGYATIVEPYWTVFSVAKIVTFVCALVEFSVLILFGFLFVYRQREASATMLMLGTGKTRVCGYFLYSSAFVALIASSAGTLVGYLLHKSILLLVGRITEIFSLTDTRFSNWNLSVVKRLEFSPELSWKLFAVVGVVVFSLAVFSCLIFTLGTFIRNKPSQKKAWGPNKERKTSHLRGGSLKYALLSIFRGGGRSLVVPILAITVVIFFGQLISTIQRYNNELDSLYDGAAIDGHFTDINGKQLGNLVLSAYDVGNLYHSGFISNLAITTQEKYYFTGITMLANGTEQKIDIVSAPINAPFHIEALATMIQRGPNLVASNSLRKTPEFYYADYIELEFLDGYDESILAVAPDDPKLFSCILPTSLMIERGISLGDTVRLTINDSYSDNDSGLRIFRYYDLKVVGSYEKQWKEDTIYIPIALKFDTNLIWNNGVSSIDGQQFDRDLAPVYSPEQKDFLQTTTFKSANFQIGDLRSLADFKDFLNEYGFSQVNEVGSVREFIVLRDGTFNNAVSGIVQQIRYMNLLYPCLYLLVGIIGYVVSYLLVISRKNEFAIIRGLGGTKNCSFFSFFFEQSFLAMMGALLGLGLWWFFRGTPVLPHLLLVAGFLLCYFIGCAVSIKTMNQANVLTILLDKD